MRFIDSRQDPWHRVNGEDGPIAQPDPQPARLLTLEQWHAVRSQWPQGLHTGLLLPNTLNPQDLADELRGAQPRLELLALEFPKWTDGRAYSQARLLRTRYRFTGELRAVGDVVVDMLPLLQRCGFDAVQLRQDQRIEDAVRALGFFDGHYQGDVRQQRPAFARDLSAKTGAAHERVADLFAGQGI
jgi:uncharacterized protein (DUF934 family)